MWLRRVANNLILPLGLPASASAQTPFPGAVPEEDAPAELNLELVFHLGKITVSMNSFF
jgi:hypothetical protein